MKSKSKETKNHIIIIIAILGIIIFVYLYGFINYNDSTFGNVFINSVCIKNETNTSAFNKIKKEINSTSIKLIFDDGSTNTISYKQAGGKINREKLMKSIVQLNKETNKNNERILWFMKSFTKKQYTINFIDFDEEKLVMNLNKFDRIQKIINKSRNIPQLIYKNSSWKLTEKNSKYNFNLIVDNIEDAFQNNKKTINLKKCLSEYNTSTLEEKKDLANEFCNATIEYDGVSITPQLLLSWIETKNNSFEINDNILKRNIENFLIKNVSPIYSTKGKERNISLPNGETICIKGGTFGNEVNISVETKNVLSLIKKHANVKRTPEMSGDEANIASDINDGIGPNFIEIDLSKNNLNLIKNNKNVLSVKIISGGKPYKNFITNTPTGIFILISKKQRYNVSQLLNNNGDYFYTNPVNFYLQILSVPGKNIGICDTTDKDKKQVTIDVPVEETKNVFYVKTPDNDIKVDNEDNAKKMVQEYIENSLENWIIEKEKEAVSSINESNSQNSQNRQNSKNNKSKNSKKILTDEEIEEKRKELQKIYYYEPQTETVTSIVKQNTIQEVDKTSTYGNVEMSTENMSKLYELVDNGLPVVVH